MIRTFSGRRLLKIWQSLARFREVVAGDHRMNLILTENELHITQREYFRLYVKI